MPGNAKVLMLGSFPPPERRWSMRFYYPNRTNDMWRIMGIVFFGDKNHFVRPGGYDEQAIRRFAAERGIAMFDAAVRVVRQKNNASDKFLEVVEPIDLDGFLDSLPDCRTVVTAGEKSSAIIAAINGTAVPRRANMLNSHIVATSAGTTVWCRRRALIRSPWRKKRRNMPKCSAR